MQCVNCGRPLQPLDVLCPMCGEAVVRDAVAGAGTASQDVTVINFPPVDPFAPTVYGPPVGAEPEVAARPPHQLDTAYPPKWVGGYVPVAPHPAPESPRRAGCLPIVAGISGLLLVAVLMVGAFVASGVQLAGLNFTSAASRATHSGAGLAVRPTATLATPCVVPRVNPTASQSLTATQLSTGVVSSDPGHVDLRPVGPTSSFLVGQTVYVTFQFATNQAGTVKGEFCGNDMSGDNVATASESVPGGYRDGRGEFHLLTPLTRANVGLGVVTLTWNGAVAAVLTYTVRAA